MLSLTPPPASRSRERTGEPYFLGSIVLIKPPGQVIGQVLGGQQRLTTLTILAAVLRDAATEKQERDALGGAVYIEPNPFMDLHLIPLAVDPSFKPLRPTLNQYR